MFFITVVFLFALFYMESGYTDNTYQDMLFTTKGKIDRNNDKFGGITFKIGGNIDDIKLWERFHIGYPLRAITIDHQSKSKITQGRIEIDAIIVNVIFAIGLILVLKLLSVPFRFIKNTIDDSRVFKKNSR